MKAKKKKAEKVGIDKSVMRTNKHYYYLSDNYSLITKIIRLKNATGWYISVSNLILKLKCIKWI